MPPDPIPPDPGSTLTPRIAPPRSHFRWATVLSVTLTAVLCAAAVLVAIHVESSPAVPTITIPATQQPGFVAVRNRPAPEFTLPPLTPGAATVDLSSSRDMPIVVNFWSSTCSPCRQEMPAIAKVATKFAGRVDFIGVDTFDSPTAGASFASATGVHYPLGSDPKGTLASRYGVSGLPTTFFVSPRTQIVGMNLGALTATRLVQLLAELFHIRT